MASPKASTPNPQEDVCVICLVEFKDFDDFDSFGTQKCKHWSCKDCSRKYFQTYVKKNTFQSDDNIECPSLDCKEQFGDNTLYDIFFEIFTNEEERAWWNTALRKTFIHNEVRCPLGTCGAIFDANAQELQNCTFSECYECNRGFCMTCLKEWSEEHEATGKLYMARNEEKRGADMWEEHNRILDLAEAQQWARCPHCAHIVSIVDGCNNIICRCGTHFCYNCGRKNCGDQCYEMDQQTLDYTRQKMFNS